MGTVQAGNVRVRKVRYSPGYFADHWCEKGHALLVKFSGNTNRIRARDVANNSPLARAAKRRKPT